MMLNTNLLRNVAYIGSLSGAVTQNSRGVHFIIHVEFYVVGIRLTIRVLSENPPVLETLSELATDHAHFFTLTDNDQRHYMAMMARGVFLGRREKSNMEKGVAVY
ncbi:MAG TPA: hypothetical protein VIC08_10205 [Cellvibrionaceae bacterium]